jgi:hypothetical protein
MATIRTLTTTLVLMFVATAICCLWLSQGISTSSVLREQVTGTDHCTNRETTHKPTGDIVGFFNMYGGKDPALMERIVGEQIATIDSARLLHKISSITYAVFGPIYLNFTLPTGLALTESKYIRSDISNHDGDERDTLDKLYNHCQNNLEDSVFYIHSKGSFHPSIENDRLRQNLMKAVLHCIRTQRLEHVDVCGLRFAPIPYPHLSGCLQRPSPRQATLSLH